MTDLENIEKGIHFNRNYSKTGFTKKNSFQTNNIFIHYSHCVVEIVTEISFFSVYKA